jgi:hypothetical protein
MKTAAVLLALSTLIHPVVAQTVDSSDLGFTLAREAPGACIRQETSLPGPVEDPGQLISRFDHHSDPAGPAAEFTYELASPARVRFTVTDGSGSLSITTFPGWQTAGRYTKTVATAALDSGVYYAVLEANGLRQTRRFVVQH